MKSQLIVVLLSLLWAWSEVQADPLGTAFTYQGRLADSGEPAQGSYDFRFSVFDSADGGVQVGASVTNAPVGVANGLFATALDFGALVFNGDARWLEIGVRPNGSTVAFTLLTPRQPLTPTPYALYASAAGMANTAANATSAAAVPWSGITAMPAGFADGLDHDTTYSAGNGLTLAGTVFDVIYAGSGAANTSARSDHDHSGVYAASSHPHAGADLTSGTVADARLSANVALLNAGQVFTGSNRFTGVLTATNATNVLMGSFTGNGAGLSNLAPASLSAGTAAINISGNAATAGMAGTATLANGVANNAVRAPGIAPGQVVKSLNALEDEVTLAAGANLTLTPSGQTLTLSTPTDWHLAGNAGTSPATHFLGTTDSQPLEVKVNAQRALRIESRGGGTANLIGGFRSNVVASGVSGATIGGGGDTNVVQQVEADFGTIAGGAGNWVQPNAHHAAIGGGRANWVQNGSEHGTIGGGGGNSIEPGSVNATIGGGGSNTIKSDDHHATIAGGGANLIETGAHNSTIGGGQLNRVKAGATYATVPGGQQNEAAGAYSLAAGRRAKANHPGAFVWGDSTDADFASTANDQWLIRAAGGVGIGKNNPATALDVNGTVKATSFSGGGTGLAALNAGNLSSGTVADVRLSANVALRNVGNTFTGNQIVSSGNVGIGTAGPTEKLDVAGNIKYSGQLNKLAVAENWEAVVGAVDFKLGHKDRRGSPGLALVDWGDKLYVNYAAAGWPSTWLGGTVVVDPENLNSGALTPGLAFGAGSGEGIASTRKVGDNIYGLDFYTLWLSRLSIANNGNVGIGTRAPAEKLEVAGAVALGTTANATPKAGTVRWTGTDFEGYNGTRWVSLTGAEPVVTPVHNMVWIRPGSFPMGSPNDEQDRVHGDGGLQTSVTISRGFWMGIHEVTQAEYFAVMRSNPSYFTGDENRPVDEVRWFDATSYCLKLTEREQAQGRIPGNWAYRLPTEAEWEYACRAGTATRYSYGDDSSYADLEKYAWYDKNASSQTHPVGQKRPNAWGLYDMHGNVQEWCQDRDGAYPGGSATDPTGPTTGSFRVLRSGGWYGFGAFCRSASRAGFDPSTAYYAFGFRAVLAPVQP